MTPISKVLLWEDTQLLIGYCYFIDGVYKSSGSKIYIMLATNFNDLIERCDHGVLKTRIH